MRILALTDMMVEQDLIDRGFKKGFPKAEMRYLRWPPATWDIFSKENMYIEKNGPEAGIPVPTILDVVRDFDPEVIITHFAPVTQEVIKKAKSLEIIGCLRGGVDNVNVDAATKNSILVFNNSGRTANAVAEYTIAHMLSVSRNIAEGHHAILNGEWWRPEALPSEIYGSTIGLIGFGNISQKLTERLQGFNVKILAYDPYVTEDIFASYGAKRVELKALLSQADYISLHCRLNTETKNMIGEAEFSLMKPTAYLINTARAGLVDKVALLNALRTHQIKGVALDVFWQEPPNKDDPLLKLNNISLSPHMAGASEQTTWYTIWLFVEALQDFLKTHQSRSIVNYKPTDQLKTAEKMKLVEAK